MIVNIYHSLKCVERYYIKGQSFYFKIWNYLSRKKHISIIKKHFSYFILIIFATNFYSKKFKGEFFFSCATLCNFENNLNNNYLKGDKNWIVLLTLVWRPDSKSITALRIHHTENHMISGAPARRIVKLFSLDCRVHKRQCT